MRHKTWQALAWGVAALWLASPAGWAADIEVTRSGALPETVRRAKPGTRIVLPPGAYPGPCKITGARGTAAAMIRIVAKDPARPPVFSGGDVAFQLIDCQYVIVDGLIAEKATVNNIQVGDKSHHVILKDVVSRDIAGQSNCDGIKAPDLTDFLMYRCTVARWGAEGSAVDMVGCARGLMMKCRFTYPKPKGQTANCIQPKGGTHDVGVYRCRFDDANFRAMQFGGRTGKRYFFRNNLKQGYEAYDVVAMGNVLTKGESAAAFVSCTKCAFAYNTIVDPGKHVVRILNEGIDKPVAGNVFARNLIVYAKLAEVLNHGPKVDLASHRFEVNYWYNRLKPAGSIPKLRAAQTEPAGGEDPKLDKDFKPAADAAKAYGAHAPGLEKAWAEHVKKFEWAWKHAVELEKNRE